MADDGDSEQPTVLTIAGFDPSGGAGIIADVKTIQALGCRPVAVITSLTFQNSRGVFGATHQSAESLRAQMRPIIDEFRIDAVKIGMLPTSEIVSEIARLISEHNLPAPVVDPVIQSSSGHELMSEQVIGTLLNHLLPLARVITPNIPEAERLTGMTVTGEDQMRQAAKKLRDIGARAVLIKGGHLRYQRSGVGGEEAENKRSVDVLDDEGEVMFFRSERIMGAKLRGSGCILSAAIAAGLAKQMELTDSVGKAKSLVMQALRRGT